MLVLVAQDFGPEGVVEAQVQAPPVLEPAAVAAKAQDAAGVGAGGLIVERDAGFEHVAQGLERADGWIEEAVEGLAQGRAGREAVAAPAAGCAFAQILVAPVLVECRAEIEPREGAVLRADAPAHLGSGLAGGVRAAAALSIAQAGVAVVVNATVPGEILAILAALALGGLAPNRLAALAQAEFGQNGGERLGVEVFGLARFQAQAVARAAPASGVAEVGAQGAVEAVLEARAVVLGEAVVALEGAIGPQAGVAP